MNLQALVLSRDQETLRVLRRVFDELSMSAEIVPGARQAEDLLKSRRFDGVIVDCDDVEGAVGVLRSMRLLPSNKRAMGFAIINGTTTVGDAFNLGANFVIDKPLTLERVQRSFKAAHGLMVRERRRYWRNPLSSPAFVITSEGKELKGRVINLSEGGAAVKIPGKFTLHSSIRVRFDLPNPLRTIEAKAEVTWLKSDESVGLRFLHIEQKMQSELENWIAQQTAHLHPQNSAPVFINATRT
jgi:CheY-like chemotaxis protein